MFPAGTYTRRLPSAPFDLAQLSDAFRVLHPAWPLFTRHTIHFGELLSSRRLDSIFISRTILPALHSTNSKTSTSDHSAVSVVLSLFNADADDGLRGIWRLHRDIHLRPSFAGPLRRYCDSLHALTSARSAPIESWAEFKENIRAEAHNLSLEVSRHLRQQQQARLALITRIERIDVRAGDAERAALVAALAELKQTETDLAQLAADLFVSRHDANMLRPTAWIIPRLESRSFAPMPAIKEGRQRLAAVEDKLRAVERFYQQLFTPRSWDNDSESASQLLLAGPSRHISNRTREDLDRPFTVTELEEALRRRPDSSAPGLDGMAYPILKILGPAFLEHLSRAGNAMMTSHSLPDNLPMLRGVLLPKKGDLSLLANYRPLSIADADFRLLGVAMSYRLQAAAEEVIPPTQTGFIRYRQSAFNVVTLYLVQHAIQAGKIVEPVWVLNLDQQKAYDRVRREWLDQVLAHYGFGERFRTYLKELYRHPTLRQTVEGQLTDPIPLHCGLLQGDPMSCLLFNLSLQPLLDFICSQEAGVLLPWDESQTARVSSLAFADDVLVLAQRREDVQKFQNALALYELASNAKLNRDKSEAFAFRPPTMTAGTVGAGGIRDEDIPFPILGHNRKELKHLGYPIRLDGGIPEEAIATVLQAIKAKIQLLNVSASTLIGRIQICNTFLLTKLWHTIRICPLPFHLDRQVRDIIQPYLFKGHRHWLRAHIVTSPRSIGGLGLLHPFDMADALFGQILCELLLNDEPIGKHFRHALHHHLWAEYEAIPAHFILRSGLPWLRMSNRMVAQRSFLSRAVYTLARLRLNVAIDDWNSATLTEILALPWYSNMYGYTWQDVSADATQAWERNGIRTWADILWFNDLAAGRQREHPHSTSAPLVPPSASGVKTNYVTRTGWPSTYLPFSRASGLVLHKQWNQMWETIPSALKRKLYTLPRHYQIHPDLSDSRLNPRPHDRPFDIDTNSLHFPWRFATLAGVPLGAYTVRQARVFLAPTEPIVPDWSFASTSDDWKMVWRRFNEASLLSTEALSDVYLFLHRRPWLAQKPRTSLLIPPAEEDTTDTADHQPQTDAADAFHNQYTHGVTRCMVCMDDVFKDSAAHGYVECPAVQEKVWVACQPVLRQLLGLHNNDNFPTDLRSIVFSWRHGTQHSRAVTARVCLWRNTIIHLLARRRHEAIVEGLNTNHAPTLSLDQFASQATTKIVSLIMLGYTQATDKPAFLRKWVVHGLLFQVVGPDLVVANLQERAAL